MNRFRLERDVHLSHNVMRTFAQDFRFALRILSRSPGFTAIAVLTLALGIASSTTVFSWIDALLLHPFPGAAHSDQLAVLEMSIPSAPNGGTSVSFVDLTDYRTHLKSLSGLTLQRYVAFSIGESANARPAWGELVSASYFDVLGVRPLLGSLFRSGAQNDLPGAYPVAVISERLWRGYFHADPAIVGQTVRINRRPLTILGVTPDQFHGTAAAMLMDLWVPVSMGAEMALAGDSIFTDRGYRDFACMVVRLRPGVTIAGAQSEVAALAASLAAAHPDTNRGVSANIVRPWYAHSGVGDLLLSPLLILMLVSLVLLLIVCANVANLLLARSVVRYREFGVRLALGASPWRIARQLITETLLLAILGAFAGLLILPWMWNALLALLPNIGLPLARDFQLNGRIAAFAGFCCGLSALVAGAAPALLSARSNLNEVLKQGGRSGSTGAVSHRARNLLVVVEVALAAVALISAGLFLRSFRNMRDMRPGFDSSHVLFSRFFLEGAGLSPEDQRQYAIRLRRNLLTEPGIQSVSYSDFTPLSVTAGPYNTVEPEGYVRSPGESMKVNRALVAPGYFEVMRIPLLAGRDFLDSDTPRSQPVLIVNQTFSRRYFHTENPIGRKVRLLDFSATVVGLARDSKYFSPAEPPRPFFYFCFPQVQRGILRELYVFLRTDGEPEQAIPTLRRVALATNSAASSFHAVSLTEYAQVALFPQKVAASLMSSLGLMCLFLAALGLYSVMSCAVNQRTQEIGVRMAMGALPGDVIAMVVRQGMMLVFPGLACGIAVALALTRLASGVLIQVSASDPVTFAAGALFLALIALLATWLPARRATRIDPVTALRQQ